MGEKPGAESKKILPANGGGLVRTVWHLGLLLQQGQVCQIILTNDAFLEAALTKDGLEFRDGVVGKTSKSL